MTKNLSVLFIGESYFVETIETKGFDSFSTSRYEESVEWIQKGILAGGMDFKHIPCHKVEFDFPDTLEQLKEYDVIMLSDVGANTFLLPAKTFFNGQRTPNKLEMIRDFVEDGGGFCMIGGYMSFQGIEAKGKYHHSVIEEILPVTMLDCDDRTEVPQGFHMNILAPEHPIFSGIPEQFPYMLGYNKVIAKKTADVLAENNGDPIITIGSYGNGRTMAYACDCAPHWASLELCTWQYYNKFWQNIVTWLAGLK